MKERMEEDSPAASACRVLGMSRWGASSPVALLGFPLAATGAAAMTPPPVEF